MASVNYRISNFDGIAFVKGLYVGRATEETLVFNSSGAFVGAIMPSAIATTGTLSVTGVSRLGTTSVLSVGASEQLTVLNTATSAPAAAVIGTSSGILISGDFASANNHSANRSGVTRTIVTSQTDTSGYASYLAALSINIPAAQTYTNTNTGVGGITAYRFNWPGASSGTLAVTQMCAFWTSTTTLNTGTGKAGIVLGSITGATNNSYIVLGQTTIPAGQYAIYSAITSSSLLSGDITATAFIPSGSTVPTNGMYLSAANTLAFATNSTLAGTVASTTAWSFGTVGGTQGHRANGTLSINGAASAVANLEVAGNVLTGTNQIALYSGIFAGTSAATASIRGFSADVNTAASSFTSGFVSAFYGKVTAATSSTITRAQIFDAFGGITATGTITNRAILTDNHAYTGSWAINLSSTAPSQFSGLVGHIQSTNNVTDALPTQAEMVTALGAANQGTALVGFIKDANADTNYFICVSNGTSWYALKMTKGA